MSPAQALGLAVLGLLGMVVLSVARASRAPVDQDEDYAWRTVRKVLRYGEAHDDLVHAWRDAEGLWLESELGPIRLLEPQLVAVAARLHRTARLRALAQTRCPHCHAQIAERSITEAAQHVARCSERAS